MATILALFSLVSHDFLSDSGGPFAPSLWNAGPARRDGETSREKLLDLVGIN